MSKRVVLVYPRYVSGWQAQPRMATPMNLLSIASPIMRAGYAATIIDQRTEPGWRSKLIRELDRDPICVGISSMTGPQLKYALQVSEMVKHRGNAPVVWGGVHPTLLPQQTIENKNIDIVVQGEGEETFLELVRALDGKTPLSAVKGIWYKDDGIPTTTGSRPFVDLNQMPPPAYELVDLHKYRRVMFDIEHQNFFTSRGCRLKCSFCFNTVYNKRQWRAMEPDLVVSRIQDLVKRQKVKGLVFNDSNFFMDMDRGRTILKRIVDENLGIVISKINIDPAALFKMTSDDYALLYKAGCRRLPVAVESGSQRIRALLRKPVDVQRLIETNRSLKLTSIVPNYLFMMGIPSETREDLAESVSLAFRLTEDNPQAGIYFNIFTPYPGTELFEMATKQGLQVPDSIEGWIPFNYRNLTQNAPWLSPQMKKMVRMLDFCSFFIGYRPFLRPTEETKRLAVLVGRLYAPVARRRARSLWYQFPIEVSLARVLRIYGKQH